MSSTCDLTGESTTETGSLKRGETCGSHAQSNIKSESLTLSANSKERGLTDGSTDTEAGGSQSKSPSIKQTQHPI